jgi:fibronectin type 3 domain-containing protein
MASEIGLGGSIRSIAYYKASGDDIEEIQPVSVYMKHTTLSAITTGVYSTAGYTLVYSGVFPNNASTGWMEVNLNNMFEYNGLQNLSILVVKGYQLYNNAYPRWHYSTTATNRVRQNHSDSAAPTSLTATNFLPNIKIKMFPDSSILFPPQSLVAQGSNRTVALTWQAPISGTPTSYNVYRNSLLLENVTEQSYYDISVTNGTTYSYYLKALYDTEESTATSTVQATPHSTAVASAVLGTGTTITAINNPSPINITYKSSHGQSVYTQAELNAAGVYGPINITQLGFYIVTAPNLALPNFIIRMKHTTATNASVWHTATDMQTVYTSASYMPTVGGYDMLTFSTPFTWNGTDNIVVDTAFGLVANWSQTGTIQYTTIASGYRYTWSDTADQTDVYSGNSTTSLRPNIRISVPAGVLGATISMPTTPLSFGAILVGATTTQQISIQNTGNQILAGYITCPAAYSIAVVRTANTKAGEELEHERDRTGYNFTVPEGTSKTFAITFAPTSVGSFSGNVVVTTNSTTNSVLNLPVSGSAIPATLATPVASVMHNGASVVVQWNTIPNANLYKVFKSNSPNGPFTLLGTTTQLQYTDVAADHGFYYVQASDTNPTRN